MPPCNSGSVDSLSQNAWSLNQGFEPPVHMHAQLASSVVARARSAPLLARHARIIRQRAQQHTEQQLHTENEPLRQAMVITAIQK